MACEDYPCCGHELGDCEGRKYGSDESIKEYARKHVMCDHEAGVYDCEDLDYEEEEFLSRAIDSDGLEAYLADHT